MAKEKKEKKEKEEKKKEKKEKKGKKEKKEKEEKPKKEKKGKKDKKEKEKKEKPKKEKPKKKKKGKKGEAEEPETEALEVAEDEGKGKKGKKKKGGKGKKGSKKDAEKEGKKSAGKDGGKRPKKDGKKSSADVPSPGVEAAELPEGAEAVEEPKYPWFNLSWAALHILGMLLMLCDSLWINLLPGSGWVAGLGRVAYPIFAFLLVEGYFHTQNLWLYLLRLLGLAVLSEIPFNLLYGGSIVYPLHQNVIWTYIIGLLFIILLDEFKERFGQLATVLFFPVPALMGYFLGQVLLTDYYGAGVFIILMFYLFHGRHWGCLLGQLVCLWFVNIKFLGGYYYVFPLLGYNFEFIQQGFATMALIPIWLYHGRQGLHGRVFRWFCYVFYPVHMLILLIIRIRLFG